MTLGNLVLAMFPRLPIDIADPVERLRRRREMATLKEQGQARASGLMLELVGALPAPVNALLGRLLPELADDQHRLHERPRAAPSAGPSSAGVSSRSIPSCRSSRDSASSSRS